ncbi:MULTISPECIES: pyrroline-5-carboxylate reductase [unclassified Enterococcus]|uniref:pyrroline-5-carboxylate reductase n=1 Tax=unclassified Enterococcus TaxID=2608891 RepID=UPI00155712BF|nr:MULTISPECIES: pyrroline-5-carboxylate reductase [unclassified Enterococcus]MBS7577839.1 pyrroline-5-carboxylate reductase [Enterococcus sp. MMGLQ5-2]MBS7585099.1 pyrroline-5-carboxylate reductase [Enterococcus sp. MMGLQ5-1]NPD12955.1 pyrroline-5-carboxylate reductase [Enterococcus sp. MMGLQ5-1]NPD37669.1 pyrroline-5-carboxylate reductase [Enterococcus sp. MMGLQ5-2]
MKIGFIGHGNMGAAIIKGLIDNNVLPKENIFVSGHTLEGTEAFASQNQITAIFPNEDLVKAVDVIILAVKPHVVHDIIREIRDELTESETLLVSIAAGKTISELERAVKTSQQAIIRVMPNVNAIVGASVTGITTNQSTTPAQLEMATKIFESIGSVYNLSEESFSIFTALAGSAPAFAYLFIDGLARSAVKHGLPKPLATQIATEMVLGSAKLVAQSDDNPWGLIDKVSSPGGTTIEGVLSLEADGFVGVISRAIDATYEKDQKFARFKENQE